jgi:DNA-binding response OmpR family regulator
MKGVKRILVVDDDTFLRMLVSIELPDCELLEADRAEEAYELARAEQPDAILIDVRLPDGDGIDLLRRLRRTGSLATTPILIITAGHDEALRTEIMRAGADEYLPKPIEGTQLVQRLERLLSIAPTERRLRRRDLVDKLEHGTTGDPDPPPVHTDKQEDQGRGRIRRRHRRD